MSLLAPAGLVALALLPVIVAIHLWRIRYRRHEISSTLLWSRVLSETPLRRPRRLPTHLLLLALQLAALAGGVAALARPAWVAAGTHRHLLVAVDTSLAMSATDVRHSRLTLAKDAARALIDGLGPGDTMTIVDAGSAPRVLVTSDDHVVLRRALDTLRQGYGPSSLGDDAPLLTGLAAASGQSPEVYLFAPLGTPSAVLDALSPAGRWSHVASRNGRVQWPGHLRYSSTPTYRLVLMGASTEDRGVAGLTVSCTTQTATVASGGGAAACEAYARLVNTAAQTVRTRITANVDGAALTQTVSLPPNSAAPIGLALPPGSHTVELRLDGHDALPADDAGWAAVPLPVRRTVLLVTTATSQSSDPGAPLIQALQAIPNLRLTTTTPDAYTDAMTRHADLTVLDTIGPEIDPPGNVLVVNPTGSTSLVTAAGTVSPVGVAAVRPDDPLLGGVDLSSLVISSATLARLPAWAHADVEGTSTGRGARSPLLFSGTTGGRRVAVLLFDPRTTANANPSNLDTLLAFPALLQSAVQVLAPAPPLTVAAGQVAALPVARQGAAWLQPVGVGSRELQQQRSTANSQPPTPYSLPSSGDLAALPALRPGLYTFAGGAGGGAQPIAANAAVPGDPAAPPAPAPAPAPPPLRSQAPSLTAPAPVTPWEGWALLALLALFALGGEWWYYVRRT